MKHRKRAMKVLRIAVCDDDLVMASEVETLLIEICKRKLLDVHIEVYSDGYELWEDMVGGQIFDLLYLDIKMEELDGISVARRIREKDKDVTIIYVSRYEEYLIELFEVEPFRFLRKPISKLNFQEYFMKAYDRIVKDDVYFEYKFNKVPYKLRTKDIIYFESSGRLIKAVSIDTEGKFYGKLSTLEVQLEASPIPFLRIHQSFLVNYRHIKKMSFSNVLLFNGTNLKISEDRQKLVRAKYNALLGGEYFDT